MVRDRFGVRPLYYALDPDGTLVFGSEAKALFASGACTAVRDLAGIDEVFTLWGARAARHRVRGRPPGSGGRRRHLGARRRSSPSGAGGGRTRAASERVRPEADLEQLLRDSVRLRLRADVPVGTYLSGGLDSSLITALAREEVGAELRTFSVAFRDPRYDERTHQEEVARAIGTRHHVVEVGAAEIAGRVPGRRAPRRDAADPHRAGAALPARPARSATTGSPWSPAARAPTSCSGATTCSRRSSCAS